MSQQERWQLGGNAPEIYDRYLVPALFGPWAPILIEQAGLKSGERVLDVACGTGAVTRLAASHVGAAGHVTGVDINPGMLNVARSTPTHGAPVEWKEANAMMLPFPDGRFGAVFCQLGLQYFPDRVQALREMRRVLMPGGRLVLLVWRGITHSPGYAALTEALERHVGPAAASVMQAPFVFGDTPEELRALMSEAGFETIKIRSDVRMVRFESPEAFVRYQAGGSPLASHVAGVDDSVREALVSHVNNAMQAYMNDEGIAFPIEGHIAAAQS